MKIKIIRIGLDEVIVEMEDGTQYIVDTSGCSRGDQDGCVASVEGEKLEMWYEVDVLCWYGFYVLSERKTKRHDEE